MIDNPRYLTKSRFKLALECPTKLYYTGKRNIYYDGKLDNEFLKALAEGGFQVGELAKLYYRNGVNISTLDYEEALDQTNELLKQDNVIIYEAAFRFENLFIRADIVIKKGNDLHLIEVKAKSFDEKADAFLSVNGEIKSKWAPYLFDVAFQKWVITKAWPEFKVHASLLLADKTKVATVDGLNQLFFIHQQDGRSKVDVDPDAYTIDLGEKILINVRVDDLIDQIWEADALPGFEKRIQYYSEKYASDEKIPPTIGDQCGKCEFKPDDTLIAEGFKSGFHECWQDAGLTAEELSRPMVLSLWDFRKKDEYIKRGTYFLHNLTRADLEPTKVKKDASVQPGLSRIDRQEMQIEKSKSNDDKPHIDLDGLRQEMQSWKYPLHFIDFETSAVAIPFNAARRPYEQMAFQFSHHEVRADGAISHKTEWINDQAGKFPNFEFVRALKAALEHDEGTIFRYAAHENTILNAIYVQLMKSREADRLQLCEWIKTITHPTKNTVEKWQSERDMVDLWALVKKYYYHPATNGSNSIKHILPAIISSCDFIKNKYRMPVYGGEIASHNFRNQIWITYDEKGKVINPYHLLPPIFDDVPNEVLDELLLDEETGIADGGAAMMAYARMQFTRMSSAERKLIRTALLRYCELDTFAMVLIYESWMNSCFKI